MRVGAGPPSSLDWLYEVRNGRAFTGYSSQNGVAAELSHIQLLNPVGSGKTVYLYSMSNLIATSEIIHARQYDTALTTLQMLGSNMKLGGAASVAQVRRMTNPTLLGTYLTSQNAIAATQTDFGGVWLFVAAAGQGLVSVDTNPAEALNTSFFWVER